MMCCLMKWDRVLRALPVSVIVLVSGMVPASADAIAEALSKVNEQCPAEYPEAVDALPEAGEFAEADLAELTKMLQSWNPSLRVAAAKELGQRGDEAMPVLMQGVTLDDWTVRAGTAQAMASIVQQKMRNWQEAYPEITNASEAQARIREDFAAQANVFIGLAKDPRLEVRVAALSGLSQLAPPTDEATQAVLALCQDEDSYLAQDAMITLEKRFSASALQQEQVVSALKEAMKSSLPRGKGHVVVLISRMSEKTRRQFIPELLAHLDWQPNRDTMFGAGGQEQAVRMLTEMEVKELVPRLPKLMTKTMRGPGLFEPCLKSARAFGAEAKVILPELQAMAEEIKPTEAELKGRNGPAMAAKHQKLAETIRFIEEQ